MPQIRTSAPFDASADQILSVIADVESYAEFMPGIVSSQVLEVFNEDDAGVPLEYEVEVSIGLSIFNGKVTAKVERDDGRGALSISLLRGPVRRAECRLEVRALDTTSSEVSWDIDYETPLQVIDKLIALYQDPALYRVIAAFQDRAREVAMRQSGMR